MAENNVKERVQEKTTSRLGTQQWVGVTQGGRGCFRKMACKANGFKGKNRLPYNWNINWWREGILWRGKETSSYKGSWELIYSKCWLYDKYFGETSKVYAWKYVNIFILESF